MKLPSLRTVSQVAVLVLVLALALAHQWWGVEKAAPLDAYCPFGALESLPTLLTDGNFLTRIFTSNYLLLGIFTVMTLLFGRVFCGYFCPLGAVQEWLTRLGRALGIHKAYELPPSVDRVLRYAKYLVLAGVVFLSWAYASLVFRDYDPFVAFGHLGNEFDELVFAYAALAAVVVLSLFTKSWWCRYLCPLGAFFGIVRKIGLFRLAKAPSCAGCGACAVKCPAGLDPKAPSSANDADCVSCMGCVGKCPSSSLAPVVAGKKLSRRAFEAAVVFGFFAALTALVLSPFWAAAPVSNLRLPDGTLDLSGVRGSNTLGYLIKESGVPLEHFQKALGLPADVDLNSKLKHIGEDYGLVDASGAVLETEAFRDVAQAYLSAHPASTGAVLTGASR